MKLNNQQEKAIANNLLFIVNEIAKQEHLQFYYPPETMSFNEQIEEIREYIDVYEYGLAYEGILCIFNEVAFEVTSNTAIKLLEVGLLIKE